MSKHARKSCPQCQQLQRRLEAQAAEIKALRADLLDLRAKLAASLKNSSTSSKPPVEKKNGTIPLSDQEATQLWNAYQTLRDEIKTKDTLNFQILGGIIAATTGIFIAGFTQTSMLARAGIFISVYVVTIPAYRLLQGNRRCIWRTATYLRVFLEPELKHVQWESRLSALRRRAQQRYHKSLSTWNIATEWQIVTLGNTLATLLSELALWHSELPFRCPDYVPVSAQAMVCMAAGCCWLFYCIATSIQEKNLRRGGIIETNFEKVWLELKNDEQIEEQPIKYGLDGCDAPAR